MNARNRLVTLTLGGVGILAAVLTLTERSAKTQTTNPFPPVELISQRPDGQQPNGNSSGAVPSGDGRCVAFYSGATNLIPSDNNGFTDVYVFDRDAGVTTRVSVGADGQAANGPSQAQRFRPSIDNDCTCVGFSSDATNLVAGDTNGRTDAFVRDLGAATTDLVSVGAGVAPADGASSFTSVDGDCGLVAFHSVATNLVPDDTNRASDVFVFNRTAGTTTRVSVGPGGVQADGPSITPSISADGRCVAFASGATNLLPGAPDANGALDIYVACDGVVSCRASVSSDGVEANQMSFLPALSADGSIVAFKSNASNLVPGDLNQAPDVFVHSCVTGETQRVSVGDAGQESNDIAIPPSISADGRFVAFGSFASNLLRGATTNGNSQVYVRDLERQTTVLVSSSLDGQPGNGSVPDLPPSISQDGKWVAFESLATDLVLRDTQGYLDTYIRANVTVAPTATKTVTAAPTPTPTRKVPCQRDTDCPVGQVHPPSAVTRSPTEKECSHGIPKGRPRHRLRQWHRPRRGFVVRPARRERRRERDRVRRSPDPLDCGAHAVLRSHSRRLFRRPRRLPKPDPCSRRARGSALRPSRRRGSRRMDCPTRHQARRRIHRRIHCTSGTPDGACRRHRQWRQRDR